MNTDPIHIISLGAGVQSSCMALMAAAGELTPMPTAAIFADTQAEPQSVYTWLDWLEKQLPFPVYRVTKGDLGAQALQPTGTEIPVFTAGEGEEGRIARGCTRDFKIRPILQKARELGGIQRGQKDIGVIQWIGISLDEARFLWMKHVA